MSSRRVSICKPTGGLVDLALVVDMDAVRRNRRERTARKGRRTAVKAVATDPLHASADEKRMHASLRADWTFAAPGPEKRAALAALRAYEKRHGMDAWLPPLRDRTVAIAESSERWG